MSSLRGKLNAKEMASSFQRHHSILLGGRWCWLNVAVRNYLAGAPSDGKLLSQAFVEISFDICGP